MLSQNHQPPSHRSSKLRFRASPSYARSHRESSCSDKMKRYQPSTLLKPGDCAWNGAHQTVVW